MNQSILFRKAMLVFAVCLAASVAGFAQSDSPKQTMQVEPSYDVALHLLIGSNEGGAKTELPASLNNVSKQLKANFNFTNYRLASTFLGRISNTGNFEYKSVGDLVGKNIEGAPQTFLEWSVANFRNMPTAKGQPGFQAQAFRFGARVPVPVGVQRGEGDKGAPVYNYESIGLNLGKIGLAENTPTLVGTLNLPGADGVIFLVMTVKSADM
jgi:hypothetical protein